MIKRHNILCFIKYRFFLSKPRKLGGKLPRKYTCTTINNSDSLLYSILSLKYKSEWITYNNIKLGVFQFWRVRSEEHTSELRHVAISYAVFCLIKKKNRQII